MIHTIHSSSVEKRKWPDCVRWESECGRALRGRDLVVRSLLVLWLLRWTIRGLCCDFVSGALSAGGPYEGGVVQCMQSAGFLGAVFDGQ